jgi:hypothetical protein
MGFCPGIVIEEVDSVVNGEKGSLVTLGDLVGIRDKRRGATLRTPPKTDSRKIACLRRLVIFKPLTSSLEKWLPSAVS